MGMSASQARLLTITGRLTDNELRSQTITNSKLRLAQKSSEASQIYMDALNSEKLTYKYYNDNGESASYNLTPAFLYSYEPLKNQYSIQNASGQNLVSATDAKNYEETNSLGQFLSRYMDTEEVLTSSSQIAQSNYDAAYKNYEESLKKYNDETFPAYKEKRKYYDEVEYPAYEKQLEDYNKRLEQYENYDPTKDKDYMDKKKQYDEVDYPNYLKDKEEYDKNYAEYDKLYKQYLEDLSKLPNDDIYKMFVDAVGTATDPQSCYSNAFDGPGCYIHLLTHMLDYDGGKEASKLTYTTSLGNNITLEDSDITSSDLGVRPDFKAISDKMNDLSLICDQDDSYHLPTWENGQVVYDKTKENAIKAAIDGGRKPSEFDILRSDYVYDAKNNSLVLGTDGQPKLKTLKQKAIDLVYMLRQYDSGEYNVKKDDVVETLVNFTDGDLRGLATLIPPVKPTEPIKPELPEPSQPEDPGEPPTPPTEPVCPPKPIPPTEPKLEYEVASNDKSKMQWYTNLWYMMNGSETANVVENHKENNNVTNLFKVDGASKNLKISNSSNYKVIDDELLTSNDWLTFALKNGIVTMKQAAYFNPATDSGKVAGLDAEGYYWNSTAYSSTSDIVAVEDEVAIAKAEVKYKNTTTEIENQDKKFDQDLKKLDTEHNALQTEYEALKSVIDKNVDRSFKAFS